MIDLKQIETFVWVAELGGFRAAAEKLNTTQPAVSQRIAALEKTLQTRLFMRDTRGVQITDKGQMLLVQAQRMLDLRNDMMQTACAQHAVRGTLRLGVAETITHTWLHALIECLNVRYPALVVEIHVDTTQVMRPQLASHHIDLALLVGVDSDPKLQHLHLCSYPVVWAASPVLGLHDRQLTARELATHPIITYPANSQPYRAVRGMLQAVGVKSPRMYGCASLNTIVRMTRRGIGVSVIAPEVMQDELAEGSLLVLNVRDSLPDLNFYACWLDSPDNHIVRTVAQVAQEIAHVFDGTKQMDDST